MSEQRAKIYGPLICTADPAAHEQLFREVCAMEVVGTVRVSERDATALFAPEGEGLRGAELTVLRTPGVEAGAVLLSVEPTSTETIRDWDTRVHRDALKVIDFYAPDYDAAVAHARRHGYEVIESEASYELPEGVFREAHLWGPDNVVTAFLGGPAGFFADFAQLTDRPVSEVQSISAPVSNAQPTLDFYARVFGWSVVHEYAIEDRSFAEMIGVDELRLHSHNVGPSTREPYLGLIDYGLPATSAGSLRGRSNAPRRGLLGVVLMCDRLADVVAAAGAEAGPVVPLDLLGHMHGSMVTTPHSVPHLVLGSITASEG